MLQPHEIERALVITAHPDDVDFGAAGTVANMTDAGVEVTYCLATDGQAGGYDESISRPRMAAIRREEQTKAAADRKISVAQRPPSIRHVPISEAAIRSSVLPSPPPRPQTTKIPTARSANSLTMASTAIAMTTP